VVPGALLAELAARCCGLLLAAKLIGGAAHASAALAGVSIPSPCGLPAAAGDKARGHAGGGGEEPRQLVLLCTVRGQQVEVASEAGRVHLTASAVAVSPPAASPGLAARLALLRAALFRVAVPAKPPTDTAAFASVSAGPASASAAAALIASLDAPLQLAAVARGARRPDLAALLQVPAGADAYLPASATADGGADAVAEGSRWASAALLAGSGSAFERGMAADCDLLSAAGCRMIRGLQARTVAPASLRAAVLSGRLWPGRAGDAAASAAEEREPQEISEGVYYEIEMAADDLGDSLANDRRSLAWRQQLSSQLALHHSAPRAAAAAIAAAQRAFGAGTTPGALLELIPTDQLPALASSTGASPALQGLLRSLAAETATPLAAVESDALASPCPRLAWLGGGSNSTAQQAVIR
jgi:hypothetical protein